MHQDKAREWSEAWEEAKAVIESLPEIEGRKITRALFSLLGTVEDAGKAIARLESALEAIGDEQGVMPAGEGCKCPEIAQAALNGQEVVNG